MTDREVIEWLGPVPSGWDLRRGRFLFREVALAPDLEDGVVTAFRDGQVTLRENRRSDGFMVAEKEAGYQKVRKGDLVIHSMDAFAGAVGVSESTGKCTPEYVVLEPKNRQLDNRFFARCLRVMAQRGYIFVICPSVRERAPRFRFTTFKDVLLPVPSAAEQKAIADIVDQKTAVIDGLIEKKERLIRLLQGKRQALIDRAEQTAGQETKRLGAIVDVVSRPIAREADKSFVRIGLLNRGRGIFHKPLSLGADLGDSDFFWVEPGDLILSGQFAWEGAVALAGENEAGCVASHRYVVLRGKPGVSITAYVWALLRTDRGNFLLNEHSRGAAGRNRPLNARTLLKEKVIVPPLDAQEEVAHFVAAERRILLKLEALDARLNEYKTAIATAAVTRGASALTRAA